MKKLTYLFILAILFVSMIFLVNATKAQEEHTDSTDPVPCTTDYLPICGEDGQTYSNRCVAENQYNVEVMEEAECDNSNVIDDDDGDGIGDTEEEDVENGDDVDDNNDEEDVDDNLVIIDDQEDVDDDEGEEEEEMEESDDDIVRMRKSAGLLFRNQIMSVLKEVKETRSQVRERNVEQKQLKRLEKEMMKVSEAIQKSINTFVAYGVDDNSKRLGEGERAAVIYSYEEAYEKLPETEEELTNVIKISNGRWYGKTSQKLKMKLEKHLERYIKGNLESNPHDMSAMKIIAYGLKQRAENRNLNSERKGIEIFKDIFGHVPESTEDWNAMQAITYSGATR